MDLRGASDSESRFAAYVEGLVSVIGHADREQPLRDYCLGLLLPGERKSVEPMAAVTAPARVPALLRETRVIDDPGLDRPMPLEFRHNHLPHLGQNLLVRPAAHADKMQQ